MRSTLSAKSLSSSSIRSRARYSRALDGGRAAVTVQAMDIGIERIALPVKDPQKTANFFARVLEVPSGKQGKDPCVRLAGAESSGMPGGGPSVVFVKAEKEVEPAHVAFRLAPGKFAQVLFALAAENQPFGNDPANPTNSAMADTTGGGMGRVYFRLEDGGHLIEFCC